MYEPQRQAPEDVAAGVLHPEQVSRCGQRPLAIRWEIRLLPFTQSCVDFAATGVLIQRMAKREAKPDTHPPVWPTFTRDRLTRAIWITEMEAQQYMSEGDVAEGERLLDMVACMRSDLTLSA